MAKKVFLTASVNAPIEAVFDCLNSHETFGQIWSGRTRRVKDSSDPNNANGVGSEREIKIGPIPGLMIFREAIITCERPTLLEYQVVGRAPIKNHLGRIEFSETKGVTQINYSIALETVIPGLTATVLKDVEKQWLRGFPKLKARLEAESAPHSEKKL